ncbi:substrate-binding domain-containing protein [Malaciobacter marinus]|uniref:substrate-binding domain-containing protein n=1 Tax=Malaciobacter marinus TaxID=505249 RepID=UPI0009D270C0|nr:substrate-binding domain-containing protein [Malaciobacter marinus]SKB69468.1 monosaccharide ABC transporter substrate-binding protein, CUT2 family [Malaciobacter marinus]
MFYFKFLIIFTIFMTSYVNASEKKLIYIVSDIRIPFWEIMSKGIKNKSSNYDYDVEVYSSSNSAKIELENTVKAIRSKPDGLIVSPTNSSACVTILKFVKEANIPAVILDIGTDSGEYLSYISSDNKTGAYNIGKVLVKKMQKLGYEDGSVAIVAVPQKRINGQERTRGFLKALSEAKIKSVDLKQQITWTQAETYIYTKEFIKKYPNLRAVWLQGSDRYQGALDAINELDKKGEVLLLTFDAEPEFIELIQDDILVGSAMQQPYLMGQKAVEQFYNYFNKKEVIKNIQMPILAISKDNIKEKLPLIKRNVLGIEK